MAFRKTTYTLLCIPLFLLFLLEAGTLWHFLREIVANYNKSLANFKWVALGVVVFMAVRYLIIQFHWPFRRGTGKANLEWMETDMHEHIHQLVALFLGRRLHSLHVEQNSGLVTTSGNENNRLFVTLAPYCLPVLTLIFVTARAMIKQDCLWIQDIVIGLTMGFHGVCICKQTRSDQPDINQFPLHFAYLYIATFLLLNITIILVCIGMDKNLWETLQYIFRHFWTIITAVFG